MSVLNEICKKKRDHIETQKNVLSLDDIKLQMSEQIPPRGFINRIRAMNKKGIALITEVKKASPSKGLIRENFDPALIAKTYEENGAACISVLTDEPYFQGHDNHFKSARAVVNIPMIRKDFMIDAYQIYESRAMGADCVLLIMAALEDALAQDLFSLSSDLGMDVLVEIHDEIELQRALNLNPALIGINNRNLKTLEVNVETSFKLIEKMPISTIKIAESGLSEHGTIKKLKAAGYSGFLVGESLMREPDIANAVKKISGHN